MSNLLDTIKNFFGGSRDQASDAVDDARADAVNHDRQPGVPPEHVEDYADTQEDMESAESFPASDPPANY